jgi:hypothetical protein
VGLRLEADPSAAELLRIGLGVAAPWADGASSPDDAAGGGGSGLSTDAGSPWTGEETCTLNPPDVFRAMKDGAAALDPAGTRRGASPSWPGAGNGLLDPDDVIDPGAKLGAQETGLAVGCLDLSGGAGVRLDPDSDVRLEVEPWTGVEFLFLAPGADASGA